MSEPSRSVLFVDDASDLLDGLRNGLRGQRRAWRMRFADGGEAALRLLAEAPADVVITDMRMPGMDGLELLRRVQQGWPETVRVVLSGQADLSTVIRASAVAHQYLAKPCDMEILRGVIARAFATQDELPAAPLRQALGLLGSLPASERVMLEVAALLSRDDVDLRKVAPLVETDAGLMARLLQFANSPYCGLTQAVEDAESALLSLGPSTVRQLLETLEPLEVERGGPRTGAHAVMVRHALLTARLARRLAAGLPGGATAYAAALLHQAGELVLASRLPDRWDEVRSRARLAGRARHDVEREVLGADHSQLGGYLLGLWGLPADLVEAVRRLHDHRAGQEELPPALRVARCAAWLAQEVTGHPDPIPSPDDRTALERAAGDRLATWRGWAAEEVEALRQGARVA